MDMHLEQVPKVLELYLQISQYPILGRRIRERMREELFSRGVISRSQFEREVREKAVSSQEREGISDPFGQESGETWRERLEQIRDHLTDFYFAYNLPHKLFEEIMEETLSGRKPNLDDCSLPFNPELAPRPLLIAQAKEYARLPAEERLMVCHHQEEITVVLLKRMISDQMDFVKLAKRFLKAEDFEMIYNRRIGTGKIGGKAAGMVLAWEILRRHDPANEVDLRGRIAVPDSYFIGANVFYDFHTFNGFEAFINQKYKGQEEIEDDYPRIQDMYANGRFPKDVMDRLRALLQEVVNFPLIVRSSSLLEDNFGFSFAGKYDSYFCPNQGTMEENLAALTRAIGLVYASVLSPDALLYRQRMGLVDYDERMAILIQKVQGKRYHNYFFPAIAGVGFSRNPFRWHSKIRAEDGLLRLVWGLGTRAVDRVGEDYPRMVSLSHPQLRPETGADQIRRYSQRLVDLIDLQTNTVKSLPVTKTLQPDYPGVQLLASVDKGDYLQAIYAPGILSQERLVLTFDELLKNRGFVAMMRTVLAKLERGYGRPVDVEFVVEITDSRTPDFCLHLLQCRPLSRQEWGEAMRIPDAPPQDVLFLTRKLVPTGQLHGIRYVVYVDPEAYNNLPDYETRFALARLVGRINRRLEGERFILIGPGRWGTSNPELGLKVTYADIYNTLALIEAAGLSGDDTMELSYGTHFFQDLVESRIYPLPLHLNAPDARFNWAFFKDSPNKLADLLPDDERYAEYVKVIDVPAVADGRYLDLVMDGERDEALAYLASG